MHKTKRLFTAVLICLGAILFANAQSGSCGTALTWSYADGVLTISGTGEMYIGNTASYNVYYDQIKSVVVGEGVTSIDDKAFKEFTSLESVKFPSTLISIGQEAFSKCMKLKKIELPESLQKIGPKAFEDCDFYELTIPRNVIEVGSDAFDGNRDLDVVAWNCNIPRETYMEEIPGYNERSFFGNTSLRKVVFGPEVTEIPDQLFFKTPLNEVVTHGTIEYVGGSAFRDTPWMEERAAEPIYLDKCLYYWPDDANGPTKVEVREGTKGITRCVFADMDHITEVTLPASLEYIGSCVFANCVSLTKVNYNAADMVAVTASYYKNQYHKILGPALEELVVGPSVNSLPKQLCKEQKGLKEVILPEVTRIGVECFYDCSNIVKFRMDKMVYIDDYALWRTGIQTLDLPNSLEHIGFRALQYIPDQQQVVFGPNLKSIGDDIFYDVTIENLLINTSLPEMESSSGRLAAQVNHLVIGDEVTAMPPMILYDGSISGGNYVCKTLTVGRSVQSKPQNSGAFKADTLYWNAVDAGKNNAGNAADYYVIGCRKVVVGNGVKRIPEKMITGYGLEEISFPEGLEYIPRSLCQGADIKSLLLPSTVTEIGDEAFSYCRQLESVTVGWEDPRLVNVPANTFKDKHPEAVLFVPKGTEKLYAALDPWKQFVNISSNPESWEKPQCEAPVVTFTDGRLHFSSGTEGATYHYSITDSDIRSGEAQNGELDLTATYEISAYSAATGYINSDITYVTLCFLPQGAGTGVADIMADRRGVAICVNGHDIVVSGLDENEEVTLYDLNGRIIDSGNARDGKAYFSNIAVDGGVVIVRFNNDSVKVII